jgi:hypothetical protein
MVAPPIAPAWEDDRVLIRPLCEVRTCLICLVYFILYMMLTFLFIVFQFLVRHHF